MQITKDILRRAFFFSFKERWEIAQHLAILLNVLETNIYFLHLIGVTKS